MDNVFAKRFLISKGVNPDEINVNVDYSRIKTQSYLLADLIQEAVNKALLEQEVELLDVHNEGVKEGRRQILSEQALNN